MNSSLFKVTGEGRAAFVAAAVAVGITASTLLFATGLAASFAPSAPPARVDAADTALVEQGRHLFAHNCAHCHADDATGDEGPDLHRVRKSDSRIAAIIQNGIKGEMPQFGQKLKEADVHALIAFVRSLN